MKKAIQISYDGDFERNCKIASEAGFNCVAVNFNGTPGPSDETYDSAPAHIMGILEKNGLEAVQTHLFYYYPLSSAEEIDENLEHRVLREIEVSGKIGAPWCVWHPRDYKFGIIGSRTYDEEKTLYYNRKAVLRYLEQGEKFNTGIALENLYGRMMCGGVDVLLRLCDSFGADNVGICWDTGHANINRDEQPSVISRLGKRIKCTHIHNNWGERDDHAPLIYGNLKWEEIMAALLAVNYDGPLTLETNCPYDDVEIFRSFIRHNYDTLIYLERLAESEKRHKTKNAEERCAQ